MEQARGQEKLASVNSFIQRNYGLWIAVAWIIYPLATIFSAVTEGSRIYMSALDVIPSSAAAMLVTVVLVILIETVMYFTGKTSVDDIQAGVFSLGGAAKAAFAIKVVIFLCAMGFSVSLSLSGAHDTSMHMASENTPPILASADSLNAVYDARLTPHLANMESSRNTKWKGSVTREAMKTLSTSQASVDQIETARSVALDSLNAQNARIMAAWQAKTSDSANWLTRFAGIGELLKLFCFIFIGVYDQGVIQESKSAEGHHKGASTTPSGSGSRAPGFFPSPSAPIIAEHEEGTRMEAKLPHPESFLGRLAGGTAAAHTPPPTSAAGVPPVATGSYRVATDDDDEGGREIDVTGKALLRARANAVSNYKAWKSKTGGTEATRKKNLDRLEQEIAELDEQLAKYSITFNDDYRA